MHSQIINSRRFFLVTLLNILITVVEIVGGILSGSLALLSDAIHNLSDSFSILLGFCAQLIGSRPENAKRTFGYRRAEILAALLNALFLIIISVFLIIEAAQRFNEPQPIDGPIMLSVAIVGLLANLVSAGLLHRGSNSSLNIKATYLHILSDALSSIGVIIGGIVITLTKITWIDPLITVVVAIYICVKTWPIVHKTLSILMQSSPDLDYPAIKHDILNIDGVVSVHHVHAWMIDEQRIIFSAHINLHDIKLSEVEPIYLEIENLLHQKYNIGHVTIQAEVERGIDEELFNTPADKN
ncbi:cation diffusion facilitator family transporter [Paucilactobacillus kaifaensis]|uniref:cation diffusion facilitator family transporter n=1 Tax=Paucilactobacillus kaifaensis TaxID=2559921 RepID=UPI0010F45AA2|nr:cation diffusion facilitator family transporter [Paucilactobacillus kaifaensis]